MNIFQRIAEIRKLWNKGEGWNTETIKTIVSRVMNNRLYYNLDNRDMLREVMVKIGLKKN